MGPGLSHGWAGVRRRSVHSGRTAFAPAASEVSVQFNGDWYWIASGDRASKQIFSLVRDLFDLQVKTVSEQGPVLTVPVGR
jgi:hypothetical protein